MTTPDPGIVIAPDSPLAEDVRRLLTAHLAFCRGASPQEHVHALDTDGLLDAAVTFLSGRLDGDVVSVGALKRLSGTHAELKSMHTLPGARGRGFGGAMLTSLLDLAAARGFRTISLETGSMAAFAPARALYAAHGFVECPPFGDYTANPFSTCMTRTLADTGTSAWGIDKRGSSHHGCSVG